MPKSLLLLILAAFLHSPAVAQSVTVHILAEVPIGARLELRGDTAPLSWDAGLPMQAVGGTHILALEFEDGVESVQYKAVLIRDDGSVEWEPGDNRLLLPGLMDEDRRVFGAAQTGLPEIRLSLDALQEDAAVLWSTLNAIHPGLLLHNTPEQSARIQTELREELSRLATEFQDGVPLSRAYLTIAKSVAAIRDGHTQVSMYNQGGYLSSLFYSTPDRVPFTFRIVQGRMIVTGDATPGNVLPRGTEVLALDGRPVSTVLEALRRYASADGSNDAKRIEQLEVSAMPAPAQRFDVIYSLLFEPEGPLALTVRRPGQAEAALEVNRMTAADRRAVLQQRDPSLPKTRDDLLRSYWLDDGTAVVYVGSFATFNMSIDFNGWVSNAFREINARGAERLILDLRDVAGGMDNAAAYLLRHVLQSPVTLERWQGVTAYQVLPAELRPYVRSWNNDFHDLTGRVTQDTDGTYRLPANPPVTLRPAPDAFVGEVAILVDATASSATFYQANYIKENQIAPLVGQTTGGSLKGLNGGQMVFLTLPNTGIVVDVPLYGSRPAVSGPDRGVEPDLLVPEDAETVIAGRDPELEAAIRLLKERSGARGGN
ncbi:MAG: hypothetical protein JJ896_03295 [Rhodothermales bacterium]|nr:hypothetical protein [Rhodothermales bacterium]MBO6778659.1 hypothetical protein [Rhodothermales bacterium]